MKRKFNLENLDCANCAAKMERNILKISGVDTANVNFFMQTMTIEAEDNMFEEIMKEVERVCKKVEPDLLIKR